MQRTSMIACLAFVAMVASSEILDIESHAQADDARLDPLQLRVEEAKAIVQLFEIRLHNVKAAAAQEDLKWANVRETYEKAKNGYAQGAIAERALRDAKEQYDWWVLQDAIQDIQEAETKLNIAKIRLRLVEAGVEVYRGENP